MRPAHPVEQRVGIEYYISESDGTGGRLRDRPADFRVEEIEAFESNPPEADPGAYSHLLLRVTLENWETNEFARVLSNRLGVSRERVSWAGTKDKRAVTTQLLSVDGIAPDEVPEIPNATLEVVGRTGRPILFGDLAGNAFEITVREPDTPENAEAITEQLRAFGGGRVGVPNYFGQQRFGSRRPVTHKVGLALLCGDWEDAVMAYVGRPGEREPKATQEARAFVERTRDWAGALERFPRALRYERSMLHTLIEQGDSPDGFRAALETLPENLQRLFVNAAQSYVFNKILSERLARGLPFHQPAVGDVVCFADRSAPEGFALPDQDRTQSVTQSRVESVTRHCERGRAFVTAPLVGTETTFADGQPGEIERKICEEVGVSREDFALPGVFESTGTRRAILVSTDLEYEVDPLTLSFRLPRGSYATVVLREYLKVDPEHL